MLKATGVMNGRKTVMIGLSFGNLDRFKAEPMDTFIQISKEQLGIDHDIVIFSGRTEHEMADWVTGQMAKGATLKIPKNMKQ